MESGLDYAEARFYNPQVNRFMNPDPAGTAAANPANPQSWNRYTYVMDNPVTGIDPSGLLCVPGHCPDDPPGGLVLTADDFDTYRQIGQRTVSHPWVSPVVSRQGNVPAPSAPAQPPATAPATPPPSNVPTAPAPAPQTDPGPTSDNPAKLPTESGNAANNNSHWWSSARLPGESVGQCVDRAQNALLGIGGSKALDIAVGFGGAAGVATSSVTLNVVPTVKYTTNLVGILAREGITEGTVSAEAAFAAEAGAAQIARFAGPVGAALVGLKLGFVAACR